MPGLAVLLVEDDSDARDLFALALSAGGHRVTKAEGGVEATKLLGRDSFDVVVTDIVMPERDGLDVINAAKLLPVVPRLVAVTGGGRYLSAESCSDLAIRLGANAALIKPFRMGELLSVVEGPGFAAPASGVTR